MLARLTAGAYIPIALSIGSIWMINRNFNGDQPLFEMVPVSRRFTVLNVYLASIVIAFISYIFLWFLGLAFVALVFGVVYIFSSESFGPDSFSFNRTLPETLATLQGSLFMVLVLIIIIFIGITIVFIRNKRYRNSAYIGLFAVVYGALSFLKSLMPISLTTDPVDFIESLSLIPHINELIMGVSIGVLLIVPLSVYMGYRLYGYRGQTPCP